MSVRGNMPFRESGEKPTLFGIIDGRIIFFVLLAVIFIGWTTFTLLIFATVFFVILERARTTPSMLFLRIKSWCLGDRRSNETSWSYKNRRTRQL